MKLLFIYPPLDDPTLPYHSLAYLTGHLTHNGFMDVSSRDLNIEFVNYCLEEEVVNDFYAEIDKRRSALESRNFLLFSEQEQFYSTWACQRISFAELNEAVAVLRDRKRFVNYDLYVQSVRKIQSYFSSIGILGYPSEIGDLRTISRGRYSSYSLADLFNVELCNRTCFPLSTFFYDRCVHDPELTEAECIGISVVYDYQLLPALHLARLIKTTWPHKRLILGGTSISQAFKYLKDKSLLKHFFTVCDGIVAGEGETAVCEIAYRAGDLSKGRIPNLITYNAALDRLLVPEVIHYENVPALGTPLYRNPWEKYLSPNRGINYSPTRGCYWNRCTFCDYGLNTDRPTSPWRERSIGQVIEDLKIITRHEKVRYVYFAVDVMAPGYLERLSDAILESDLDIRWAAELRMEKIFSVERCVKMAESGCVAVSFGMESGNQRILDLIDKGTKVQFMGETMKNFAQAGIAAQLMAFSHFPTETEAERKETLEFVRAHKEYWSCGGIGKFVLTGTALVAKNPAKFGITLVQPEGADIVRALAYRSNNGEQQLISAEEGDESFDNGAGLFPSVLRRPWAGGTDTLHSMIYYETHGRNFFKEKGGQPVSTRSDKIGPEDVLDSCIDLQGKLAESFFDIGRIFMGRKRLNEHVKQSQEAAIETTYAGFQQWQQSIPSAEKASRPFYWILQDGRCMPLPEAVFHLLVSASRTPVSVRKLLEEFTSETQGQYLESLALLHRKGYIRFCNPGYEEQGRPAEVSAAC
jgi:hypothetical protein